LVSNETDLCLLKINKEYAMLQVGKLKKAESSLNKEIPASFLARLVLIV
jgi:hypothetical protein